MLREKINLRWDWSKEVDMPDVSIFNYDCLNLPKKNFQNFDLIYLDPPFGTGMMQKSNLFSYGDSLQGNEYLIFLEKRLKTIIPHLDANGFLAVHLDKNHAAEVMMLISNLNVLSFKGDIIWSYRRWESKIGSLQNNHDTILVFSNNVSAPKQRIIISNPIIAPSSKERTGYPTQKPIKLLQKIIDIFELYTPINSVLDPFMGSGSMLVAAKLRNKKVVGFDVSEDACALCNERMASTTQRAKSL